MLSVRDLNIKEKTVLIRVDFNVPLHPNGTIADLTRIKASLPTLEFVLAKGGNIVLLSHLGRPKGKKDPKYTLRPCAKALSELLKKNVVFVPDCLALDTTKGRSSIYLLENLRFYPEEEQPSLNSTFVQKLASYGDFYVDDAFGAAHREHSSITALAACFPEKAAAGFLLEKEVQALKILYDAPPQPFHVIIGGAKVSSKLSVLKSLLKKTAALYIGGAMAFTFLKNQGYSIGDSFYEPELLEEAKQMIAFCLQKQVQLFLPKDLVIAKDLSDLSSAKIVKIEDGIPSGWKGLDIGPLTLELWQKSLQNASAVFWNGPVGYFEREPFAKGTNTIALYLSTLSSFRVIGGGDSCAAIQSLNLAKKFSHLSTGGGAAIEFLEKGTLPGIKALSK